jgi:hypothetical protein
MLLASADAQCRSEVWHLAINRLGTMTPFFGWHCRTEEENQIQNDEMLKSMNT